MDIDRMRKEQEKKGPETRTCYRCQRTGHISSNCPVKQINELGQDQINQILTEHLKNSSRPQVTVEEVQDEEAPSPVPDPEQQEEEPQYWFTEDQDNYYEANEEDFY